MRKPKEEIIQSQGRNDMEYQEIDGYLTKIKFEYFIMLEQQANDDIARAAYQSVIEMASESFPIITSSKKIKYKRLLK